MGFLPHFAAEQTGKQRENQLAFIGVLMHHSRERAQVK
jgi:hypothetical protein